MHQMQRVWLRQTHQPGFTAIKQLEGDRCQSAQGERQGKAEKWVWIEDNYRPQILEWEIVVGHPHSTGNSPGYCRLLP